MNFTLRLDPKRLRRWHVQLAERLARRHDARLSVAWSATSSRPLPSIVALVMACERLVHGVARDDATAAATLGDFAQFGSSGDGTSDLVIDFTGDVPRAGVRTWRILFDGVADEAVALAALIQGRTPIVSIVDAATNAVIASGHPGTEHGGVLTLGLGDVLARTTTLIEAAIGGIAPRFDGAPAHAAPPAPVALAMFAAKSLARLAVRRLYHLFFITPHWRVGWRFVDGPDVIDLRAHPATGWRELPDDGTRFYADPFPIEHDGRTFVFVEDFVHAAGYGVISAVEFTEVGPVGAPRPVLDTGTHLSYPFVFAQDGAVWMIPESVAAGSIDLYRATDFPGGWVKEATLVSGIAASDATVFEHGGKWWMLATMRDGGGAFSDALHAWSAPRITGPWQPHARNPLMIDIATARPAGRLVKRDGKLIRPFQDCRDGYGAALGLAEITRLDDEGFAQRVETILRSGPLWPGRRLHTLNRAGRLECIDGSAAAWRF